MEKQSKDWKWSSRWLHNWLFAGLSLFQKCYQMVVIDLSKQQALYAGPKVMLLIYFTYNKVNTTLLFIIEKAKGTILDFS